MKIFSFKETFYKSNRNASKSRRREAATRIRILISVFSTFFRSEKKNVFGSGHVICGNNSNGTKSQLEYNFGKFCQIFFFSSLYVCMNSCSVCMSFVSWAITAGSLLGPTICLPHKDGGIQLSALPKDTTSKLAGLFSTLSLFC